MRDYRDAKIMARTLREALSARTHKLTVGESLEIIAHLFGVADWNTLSVIINKPGPEPESTETRRRFRTRFAQTTEQALRRTLRIAGDQGQSHATVEHLLLSLIKDPDAAAIMKAHAVDLVAIQENTTLAIGIDKQSDGDAGTSDPAPSPAFQRVVQQAILDVEEAGGGSITGAHLLTAIFSAEDSTAVRILREHGVNLGFS
jgi:hypothetical protein